MKLQEYRLRLLGCLCRRPHRHGSRRIWYDIHHRSRKRYCQSFFKKTTYYPSRAIGFHQPSCHPHTDLLNGFTQVCLAIKEVANRLIGKDTEALFVNMGKAWDDLMADAQLRWLSFIFMNKSYSRWADWVKDWTREGCYTFGNCSRG